ncbi:MAG: heavy metal translocating P-type ATPase [Candidatus Electryonea clarkiae]|nr:heavy metal translocating P-type ATPase [Candidatus Electryonea clarkiae]MDP8289066.1 heavy metal translocating P-type ATPase [Candidatus Electryonea clarkiae]
MASLIILIGFVLHAVLKGAGSALGVGGDNPPLITICLYVLAIISGGWYIFPRALYAARNFRPDMNLLMTIAVAGAMMLGEWFEAAAVTILFALALMLESWSVGRARRAIKSLMNLSPSTARVVKDESETPVDVPLEEIEIDALVQVRPGDRVPLDGIVEKGTSFVDQAPITGESVPVVKTPGDELYSGAINGDGLLIMRVTKPASDSTLTRIIRLVEEAQSKRAHVEQWVERFARYYTPAMLGIAALIAFVIPVLSDGDWQRWIYNALVLLVIGCPCALVISTPVSIVAGIASAAKNGVLIKGGVFLEAPSKLKAIAFDKTGTLTYGKPSVQEIIPQNGISSSELLQLAASIENNSTHPIADAIVKKAQNENIELLECSEVIVHPGRGITGTIGNRRIKVGNPDYTGDAGATDEKISQQITNFLTEGFTVIAVKDEQHYYGVIALRDEVRKEAVSTIRKIKSLAIKSVVMLTGDQKIAAELVGNELQLDRVHSELLPEDKLNVVAELHSRFGNVAMVGDGVNDAPAMAKSSIGIAMGAIGTDTAIETADIALMSDELDRIPWLISHSRRTMSIIKQNVYFALGIKLVFIMLVLFGKATLWMAITADMGASLLVIMNGLRLLKVKK